MEPIDCFPLPEISIGSQGAFTQWTHAQNRHGNSSVTEPYLANDTRSLVRIDRARTLSRVTTKSEAGTAPGNSPNVSGFALTYYREVVVKIHRGIAVPRNQHYLQTLECQRLLFSCESLFGSGGARSATYKSPSPERQYLSNSTGISG